MLTAKTNFLPQDLTPQARYGQLDFVTVNSESKRDVDDSMWMEKVPLISMGSTYAALDALRECAMAVAWHRVWMLTLRYAERKMQHQQLKRIKRRASKATRRAKRAIGGLEKQIRLGAQFKCEALLAYRHAIEVDLANLPRKKAT